MKAGNYKVASVNTPAKKTLQIKGNSKKNNARVVVGKKSAKTPRSAREQASYDETMRRYAAAAERTARKAERIAQSTEGT